MKKLITLAALAVAGLARAGDYHAGEELKCQQCHTMHASRAHGFERVIADGTLSTNTTTYTPMNNLLISGTTNETCLACHNRNGTSGYDVFGAGGSTNGVRSGGALNGSAGTHVADAATNYAPGTGHTMGSTATAPGGSFASTTGFDCGDCHEVHGNAAYRNLGFTAATQPTFATTTTGTNVFDYDVVEEEPAAYRTTQVQFGSGGAGNPNRMNAFCATCHGNFHGDGNQVGTGGNFNRHPTSNGTTLYAFANSATRYVANDIVRPIQTSATDVAPGCLTCHKAHGNQRPFGLLYPGGATNTDLENGDLAGVTDHTGTRTFWNPAALCHTCHAQGRP